LAGMKKGIFCLFASVLLLISVFTIRFAHAAPQAAGVVEHFSLTDKPPPASNRQPQSTFSPKKTGTHKHSFFPSRAHRNRALRNNVSKPLSKAHRRNASRPAIRTASPTVFSQIDADYESGRLEEALWALQDLQKSSPNNGQVLFRLGKVQEDMLDFDAALDTYQRASRRVSNPMPVYTRLANLQYQMKRYSQAGAAFQNILKSKPGDAYALYMLGMVNEKTEKYPLAIQYFKKADLADVSFKQKSLYGQGISYIHLGQNGQGKALLKQSIAIDPKTDVAALAKQSLSDTVALENVSYLTIFGMYGFQFDSNVVLKPSASPIVPLITGESDFEHVFLASLNYAPPASKSGYGYTLSGRLYENAHAKLRTFDVTGIGAAFTPYHYVGGKHLVFMDATFDYYFVNYKRYMDAISVRPGFTYTQSKQLQYTLSVTGSRENYYQPVILSSSNQDGLILKPELRISGYSEDHKSSVQLGGYYTSSTTQGTDWSYSGFGGDISAETPITWMGSLVAGVQGSISQQRYRNIPVGFAAKRRDTSYSGAVSLSYHLPYFDIGVNGSYTHVLSTLDIYTYVRMLGGATISRSF